jgi:hypothetical protein
MIRCSKCGTLNKADASFCSECNAYLEWSGEKLDDATEGAAVPEQPAQTPQEAAGEDAPGSAPAETTPAHQKPRAGEATTAATPSPTAVRPPPPSTQPQARKPERASASAAPKPKAVPPAKADRPKPGDLICPDCGTGNDPTRKFCRRCGHSLIEAGTQPDPPARPWYKRRLGGGAPAPAYAAGARPDDLGKQRRRPGCLLFVVLILMIAIVAAGLAYAFNETARSSVDDTIRTVACRVRGQVQKPTTASIASPVRGEPGYAAFDGSDETTWQASQRLRLDDDADGAYALEVELDKRAFVHRLEVTPAADEPRPSKVRIHYDGEAIAVATLPNDGEITAIDICRELDRFGFRIVTTYPDEARRPGIRRIVVRVAQ